MAPPAGTARRRLLVAAALLALVAGSGCNGISGRAPLNLRLEAATDSSVKVIWSVPTAETPDKYLVYFRPVTDTAFRLVAETTANLWVHNPAGMTGTYRVEAEYGSDRYDAGTTVTTVPAASDTLVLTELNAPGDAGYGWNRTSGRARVYSMRSGASARFVDMYVTDFKPAGMVQPPMSVASPDMGPGDMADVVPADSWRASGFTDPLPGDTLPLPQYLPVSYFNYTDVDITPCIIGCHTADGHFALVKVVAVDTSRGEMELASWFQLVPGLRLLRH